MSLVKQIRNDPQYQTFVKILERTRKMVDLDASMNEVLGLHSSRLSRALTGNDRYSPRKLIDASVKDLSVRARMVEVRVRNDRSLSHLKEAMDALRRYISTEYSDELKEYSTAEQRRAFVDRVLKNANALLEEGKSVIATIDHLIKDLDQSGHGMRHIVDCLKLMENKHGSKAI